VTRSALPIALAAAALVLMGIAVWWGLRPSQVRDPVLERGRALYLEGRRADGQRVAATVLGDVPVSGAQAPCASCHGRSGMGTSERGNQSPPIAGPLLFDAAERIQEGPPYTEATLARAVREGVRSSGKPLDPLMPRYTLDDGDVAALAAYLRTLGPGPAPGIDDENLHLATVIGSDVPADVRKAVLDVLEAFVTAKNAEVRNDGARSRARIQEGRTRVPYRVWSLDVWEVSGPPKSWRRQLERQYRDDPVFAMVGGLATGTWQPMHEFCEENAIPCLLPSPDRPHEVEGDFYTLYFSGGLRLEARLLAAELARSDAHVLQVLDDGDEAAAEAASLLETRVRAAGGSSVRAAPGTAVPDEATAVVWWSAPDALDTLPATEAALYVSGTRLGSGWDALPEPLRARTHVVDLFRMPEVSDPALRRFRAWAISRGVEITHERLQAEAWFACITLMHTMDHISTHPTRDYLLDTLDHSSDLMVFLPIYPRGNVGPGQRTLAQGGWIVELGDEQRARWVVP